MVQHRVGVALDGVAGRFGAVLQRGVRSGAVRCPILGLDVGQRLGLAVGVGLGLDRAVGGRQVLLLEHDPVVAQHVVGVELADLDQLHLGQVAERQGRSRLEALDHDQHATLDAEGGEGGLGVLGLRSGEVPTIDDDDAALAGPVRQRRAQGGLDHLLGGPLRVVTRLGPEGDATTGVVGGVGRALAGVAGALLAVRLGAAAADLAAGLRRLRAGSPAGQLGRDDLVHQRDVGLHAEDRVVELDVAGVLAGGVLEGDLGHGLRTPGS